VVHQGGIGTCAEALRAGIPSLIIPFGFDQPDNAERFRRLGAGLLLTRNRVSARSLADRLRQLTSSPRFAASAQALSHQIASDPGTSGALDAIERVAAQPENGTGISRPQIP